MLQGVTRRSLTVLASTLALPCLGRAASATVRIGYQKNGSLVLVRKQDTLRALNIAAEWVEFNAGPPLLEALNAGAVDFGAVGDTPPIFAQAAGSDLLYVGGQPITGANEAILVPADSTIRTVADLRGRRLAFTKGSSAHAMVVNILAANGMKPSDVQSVYLQPPDAGAAFRTGALDAWAVWDPFYAIAQLEPTTRVLTTAEGAAPRHSFFMAGRRFVERQPAALVALLTAINEVADWAKAHPEDLARTMATVTGVPLAAERLAAPRGVYAVQPMNDAIIARQQGIADLFTALRIIPAKLDIRAIVWTPPTQTSEKL
jgi:sulfonate transport system substrate-binding protein